MAAEKPRERMRQLSVPASPIDSPAEKARLRDYDLVMGKLPPEERVLWWRLGEGEPDRLPAVFFLMTVEPSTLSVWLARRAELGSPVAPWPDLPPSLGGDAILGDAVTIHDVDETIREDVFREWRLPENQASMVESVTHGIDARLGDFLVPVTTPTTTLSRCLPPDVFRGPGETAYIRIIQVENELAAAGWWIGRFSAEPMMLHVLAPAACGDVLRAAAGALPASTHVLLQQERRRWARVSGAWAMPA